MQKYKWLSHSSSAFRLTTAPVSCLPFLTHLLFYFIYLCLHWVSIAACELSLVVESGLLIMVASLFAEHGLLGMVSIVVGHGLSCLAVCGIFLDQRSNSCSLHGMLLTPGSSGKSSHPLNFTSFCPSSFPLVLPACSP